jgi:hypothetical protein
MHPWPCRRAWASSGAWPTLRYYLKRVHYETPGSRFYQYFASTEWRDFRTLDALGN